MKKLLTLLIVTVISISCSSNSEELTPSKGETETPTGTENNADTIIGTWKLTQKDGDVITDSCERKDVYTFNDNGTYTYDDYNTKSGSCSKDEDLSSKGTWLNNNNKTYNLKKHGYTGNGRDFEITFSSDKKELTTVDNGFTYERE